MSKLNQKGNNVSTNIVKVAAKRGQALAYSANENLQFVKEPAQHLYELAVSTLFGRNTFYRTSDTLVKQLQKEVKAVVAADGLDFIANLAIHARSEMNIRTIPLVMVVEFAKALRDQNKQYPYMRQLVRDVIQRADQITDLYAYALDVFGDKKTVPMSIKRGVGDAFNKFTEYQFAKYNRDNTVKLRDVLRIVHPTARDVEQGAIFEKIMKDTMEVPYTWETQLSANGQKKGAEQKSKKDLWTELFTSGKMAYMGQLRNLRNLLEADVDVDVINRAAAYISNPEQVARSKQLPFDFVEAYDAVKAKNSKIATAVSTAIDLSVTNMPVIGKRVWIIVDGSGSMNGIARETSTLFAAAMLKAVGKNAQTENFAVTLFGSRAETFHSIDTNESVMSIKRMLTRDMGGTDFDLALKQKTKLGFEPDAVIVFTDGEVNHFPYSRLKNLFDKDTVKLTVNLEGGGTPTTPLVKEDGWYTVAGWSSAMFKWIPAMREKQTAVDRLSVPYQSAHRDVPRQEVKLSVTALVAAKPKAGKSVAKKTSTGVSTPKAKVKKVAAAAVKPKAKAKVVKPKAKATVKKVTKK